MITINDVAKLAKVSRGTVSNVLNGNNNVSLEKVKRVEEAIKTLGYQPNAGARSLKTSKSNNIAVVLPNIFDSRYASIYSAIERIFNEVGYLVTLYITSELPAKENKIINMILEQKMEGIIIVTCQPDNKELWKRIQDIGIPTVFIEREINLRKYNFIDFNYEQAVCEATKNLLQEGINEIYLIIGQREYSSERYCLDGYYRAYKEFGIKHNKEYVKSTQCYKETAFKSTMELFHQQGVPEAIVTTSQLLAEGILKSVDIYTDKNKDKPRVISICDESWTNQAYEKIEKITQPSMLAGEKAARQLLGALESKDDISFIKEVVSMSLNNINRSTELKTKGDNCDGNTIRVLMLESTAANATEKLLPDFYKRVNAKVEITKIDYKTLYEILQKPAEAIEYDVFEIDLPWLPESVAGNKLLEIDEFINIKPESIEGLIPGILDVYAKVQGNFYVLPYVYGTQLLFYRKDIFEDKQVQRHFFELHNKQLDIPKTWEEFNRIAEFFTREFNPLSPVEYGTTLGGRHTTGSVCEFLPRKWAFGGEVFNDKGEVQFYSEASIRALANYYESFKYASKESIDYWWDEQVAEFSSGKAAMMILFMAHATDIADSNKSKIAGNIGYATIPGGKPLLGGWSLGINRLSKNKELAFEFISWACGREMAIPYTLLGGATPCVDLYQCSELLSVYPWLPKALETFEISRKRSMPSIHNNMVMKEGQYEEILGEAVYSAITGKKTPEEAVLTAHKKFEELVEKYLLASF